MDIVLSKRLSTIASLVEKDSIVADIGADHGYLICSLVKNNIIKKGYAVENKKGPYKHLCETITKNRLNDDIVTYFDSGILPLNDEVNTLVLAGMGSENIIDILSKRLDYVSNNINHIICDSHTNQYFLRQQMSQLGFKIEKEIILKEGNIFYEIISFKKDQIEKYSYLELKYGPILMKNKSDIFFEKYRLLINKYNDLLTKDLSLVRKEEIINELKEIKSIID